MKLAATALVVFVAGMVSGIAALIALDAWEDYWDRRQDEADARWVANQPFVP